MVNELTVQQYIPTAIYNLYVIYSYRICLDDQGVDNLLFNTTHWQKEFI